MNLPPELKFDVPMIIMALESSVVGIEVNFSIVGRSLENWQGIFPQAFWNSSVKILSFPLGDFKLGLQ